MPHHAHGTFTVKMEPKPSAPAEGLTVFTMDKQFHGDLNGASQGEMISAGNYKLGAAGYVTIEHVTGALTIRIENGQHFYDLNYSLPN